MTMLLIDKSLYKNFLKVAKSDMCNFISGSLTLKVYSDVEVFIGLGGNPHRKDQQLNSTRMVRVKTVTK